MPKLTKIIATLGIRKAIYDALSDDASRERFDIDAARYISGLIESGMDVARFNLSFAPAEFYLPYMKLVKDEGLKQGRRIGILCDLQGPKVRLGSIPEGITELADGADVLFRADGVDSTERGAIPIVHRDPGYNLAAQLKPGTDLCINEGQIVSRIISVDKPYLTAKVVKGGPVERGKGVFLRAPDGTGITFDMSSITDKDEHDMHTLNDNPALVDHIALSFVHDASDIERLRGEFMSGNLKGKSIVAKIETARAVSDREGLLGIIGASDGVMVARGDLGIERPLAELLKYQKEIIPLCVQGRRFVVVATQMLESMTGNELPTRAEVSDVSNAVYDSADAVMLSGETAVGKFPNEAVSMMAKICRASEKHQASGDYREYHTGYHLEPVLWGTDITAASAAVAAIDLAEGVGAKAFLVNSKSGNTAMLVSRLRPSMPIATLTDDEDVVGRLTLVRGVHPFIAKAEMGVEDTLDFGINLMKSSDIAQKGDTIIYLSGSSVGIGGASNLVRVVDVE